MDHSIRGGPLGTKRRTDDKRNLCQELASAIKVIQEDHMRTKQVKGSHFAANQLCDVLEAIFLHELKDRRGALWRERSSNSNSHDLPEPSFWVCIDPLVSDEIKTRLLALRNSDSDIKKCRAWIRLMLMKGLLQSFLSDIQNHPGLLGPHYGSDAILKDTECAEIITQLLKGLEVFEFEYDFSSTRLTLWDASVLQLAGILNTDTPTVEPPSRFKRRKSKAISQISPSSSSGERISPPPSDFFHEEAIVVPALSKYTFRKSMENLLTDNELIQNEEETMNTSDSEDVKLRPHPPDFSSRSYNSMLFSYADKTKPSVGSTSKFGYETMSVRHLKKTKEEEEEEAVEINIDDMTLAQTMNFEVVNVDDTMTARTKDHIDTLTAHLTKLGIEKGLDSQNYQCASCHGPIGIVFGEAKLCKFDGHYYCCECHLDEERIIPARILMNWDFRKHRVCVRSAEFLNSIETMPVLNVDETNSVLYHYIPELEETRVLRHALSLQKDYILTCKDNNFVTEFKKRIRSSHFYEHIHFYSVKDLYHVYTGTLVNRLRKVVKNCRKHIHNCPICSQKGFICEVCQKDEILFPFDKDIYQCTSCRSVYHSPCKPRLHSDCPKCLRIEQRRAAVSSHNKRDT